MTKSPHLFLFLALLAQFSCGTDTKEKLAHRTMSKTAELDTTFAEKMDSLHQLGMFNGFSVAIVDSSGILNTEGYGYADVANKVPFDENTVINIASVSKVFIGIALSRAVEMDLLELDDPIARHLPFEVVNPFAKEEPITIRQLATHTSSIVDTDIYMRTCYVNRDDVPLAPELQERYGNYYVNPSTELMSLSDYMEALLSTEGRFYSDSTFMKSGPGSLREYSNIGAALCALVIEKAAEQPFSEFTEEQIFAPLGMTSTTWLSQEVDSDRYTTLYFEDKVLPYYTILSYPDGALISSSADMAVFLVELINGYNGRGKILGPEAYAEFYESQLEEGQLDGKKGFNVGLFIDKELAYDVIGHSGGDPGTNTLMYFNSKTSRGRLLLVNTDSQKEESDAVFWGVWDALDVYGE